MAGIFTGKDEYPTHDAFQLEDLESEEDDGSSPRANMAAPTALPGSYAHTALPVNDMANIYGSKILSPAEAEEGSSLLRTSATRSSDTVGTGSGQGRASRSSAPLNDYEETGADELFQAMELEMEARAPRNAAYRGEPVGSTAAALAWIASFAIPGLGMFTEAYFIFSVGNLQPLFKAEFPKCWDTHEECSSALLSSIHFTQVGGIIVGQLALGFAADRLGRKWGSVLTASIMLAGGVLLVCSNGPSVRGLFIMYTLSQAVFGVGVGGEYPIASSSASERAEADAKLQHRRGETVMLTFSMQGWGNWVNTALLACLLAMFGQWGAPYDAGSLETVWRLSFFLGLVPVAGMLAWRLFRLEESRVWQDKQAKLKRNGVSGGFDLWKLTCWARTYWHRLLGTASSWFVWDFAFYGNKLFQGTFIAIINPGASLIQVLGWTLVNSTVALAGYYAAAFTVDKPWMGRRRLQAMGFAWTGLLFALCAAFYDQLTQPHLIPLFRMLYYMSSFFGQWGPNATTWLLPSELFPTETRAMSHGLAAATGKAGALVAGVVFSVLSSRGKFVTSAVCGLLGVVITGALIPDIGGLDLSEGDRRWLMTVEGTGDDYSGEAVNSKYLSLFEIMLGYGRRYNRAAGRFQVESALDFKRSIPPEVIT